MALTPIFALTASIPEIQMRASSSRVLTSARSSAVSFSSTLSGLRR
jgi:hypothetical protein